MNHDIAIVGIGCRMPGTNSSAELFHVLHTSKDLRSEISRFEIAGYYHPSGAKRKGLTNVKHAYFLKDDISRFDNEFFSISPHEAQALDPQQRLLLEVTYEAVENAGIPLQSIQGSDTGVFTGLFTSDYLNSALRDTDHLPTYLSTGASNSIAANRISYFFDLHGPSLAIDTACSSTLVAFHQAVQCLKSGESAMAVVCGANLILNPDMFLHMSDLGFLSPDGMCHSFDASANGYARGEGVISILLKPLDAAMRDGDPVRAVVRGSRVNQDGRTNGLTYPSSQAQAQNIKSLYSDITLNPDDVQYFEAHATGTAVGDPVELDAIRSVFLDTGTRPTDLLVGSIKSNVGHLEACAALAGVVKTVQCLEQQLISPQMHFTNPNPKINFEQLRVPTETMAWPQATGSVATAAVNSFGFGGTNGHVVLQRAPKRNARGPASRARSCLFKLSAASDYSIRKLASNISDYVETAKPRLSDLAHTLLARRSTLARTGFVIASSHEGLSKKLRDESFAIGSSIRDPSSSARRVGFAFTGQGAHWVGMGQQMLQMSATFAAVLARCDEALSPLPDAPDWLIHDELLKDHETSRIHVSTISQPTCTALQLGLVEVWRTWGLNPCFAVGHSSGEIAAAYASGLISLNDAMVVSYYRGKFLGAGASETPITTKGAMCAVALGEASCRRTIRDYKGRVSLAAVNSPTSCTLSGDEDCIIELVRKCKSEGVLCKKLPVDIAYHSHHMLPHAALYKQALIRAKLLSSHRDAIESPCTMYSSLLARKISSQDIDADYWVKNMTSTVRWSAAISQALSNHKPDAVVEIGPHPALKGPTREVIPSDRAQDTQYFGTSMRGKADFETALEVVGELIILGIRLKDDLINADENLYDGLVCPGRDTILTDLPPYPWDHRSSFWAETRVSRNQRRRQHARHELLGARVPYDNELDLLWRNMLSFREVSWLASLYDRGCTTLPPFAFIFMIFEAMRQLSVTQSMRGGNIQIRNMQFPEALLLAPLKNAGFHIETHLLLQCKEPLKDYSFTFTALNRALEDGDADPEWVRYCAGDVSVVARGEASLENSDSDNFVEANNLEECVEKGAMPLHASVTSLQATDVQVTGEFGVEQKLDNNVYQLDPSFMAWLFSTLLTLATSSSPSAQYRFKSIDTVSTPVTSPSLNDGHFLVKCDTKARLGSSSQIMVGDRSAQIRMEGVKLHLTCLDEVTKPSLTLCYQPNILPDITMVEQFTTWSFEYLFRLLLHKWPMADIGMTNMFEDVSANLKKVSQRSRKYPRSVHIRAPSTNEFDMNMVRFVTKFALKQMFHLLFANADELLSLPDQVGVGGFVCFLGPLHSLQSPKVRVVGKILNLGGGDWYLTRLNSFDSSLLQREASTAPRSVLIARKLSEYSKFRSVDCLNIVDLSDDRTLPPDSAAKMTSTKNLIIVDDSSDTEWLKRWSFVLKFLQSCIDSLETLLWVSHRTTDADIPSQSLAGSFVRCLKTEYPMLVASNLTIFNVDPCTDSVAEMVINVSYHMQTGRQQETDLFLKDNVLSILRYQPDEEIACAVGYTPPQVFYGPPRGKYELTVVAPRRVALVTRSFEAPLRPGTMYVIDVHAWTCGLSDVRVFAESSGTSTSEAGHFFAGIVRETPRSQKIAQGTPVIGWSTSAPSSNISTDEQQLLALPGCSDLAEALVMISSSVLACCILEHVVRIRSGDAVDVNIPGPLGEALKAKLKQYCMTVEPSMSTSTFDLGYTKELGVLLNGRAITSTLQQLLRRLKIADLSVSCPSISSTFKRFDLAHINEAFELAERDPMGAVVLDRGVEGVREHIVEPPISCRRFQENGAYIIVGGLGGLGQELCRWMIRHGARHLVLISRGAARSPDNRPFIGELESLGAKIELLQVDACQSQAVRSAIAEIRKATYILGCINLAMVLSDVPFEKMRASQWDSAIRVKVETTLNLHYATLNDRLEFFIMASSVTSITGNRTQSNYAIGNAFQNVLAEERKRSGLPGVALALGPIKDSGTLANDSALVDTLQRSGLKAMSTHEFLVAMDAAVIESHRRGRALIGTGIQPLEAINGVVKSHSDGAQVCWAQWPEFGSLIHHGLDDSRNTRQTTLREGLKAESPETALPALTTAFCEALSTILGYEDSTIDTSKPLTAFGLDSLNAISCRFWFSKELDLDIALFQILGSRSIKDLMNHVHAKWAGTSSTDRKTSLPQPVHCFTPPHARPSSHAQRRLWFLHQLIADKTLHNLLLVCHVAGSMNHGMFRETWTHVLRRHEVLSAQFAMTSVGLRYTTNSHLQFDMDEIHVEDAQFQHTYDTTVRAARNHQFDLEKGKLIKGWLLSSHKRCAFFLSSHHIAWDRSSAPTVFGEAVSIYQHLLNGEDPFKKMAAPRFQYVDYTLWQQNLFETGMLADDLDYWKRQLQACPESMSLLPFARVSERPATRKYSFDSSTFVIDPPSTAQLKDFCSSKALTPFMFMTAVTALLIYRLTGDEDIVIGIVNGDRGHPDFEALVGFTVNMLPIRLNVSTPQTFDQLLENLRAVCVDGYEHGGMPFDGLLQHLSIPRRASHSPVFQVMINYQTRGSFPEYDFGDFRFSDHTHYNARSQVDFTLDIEESPSGATSCEISFDTELYGKADVDHFGHIFKTFVDHITESEAQMDIENIDILSQNDKAHIQATLRPNTNVELASKTMVPEIFEVTVASRPSHHALQDSKSSMTYVELDIATTRVASALIDRGVHVGDSIMVSSEPCVEMVIAVHGILKAGAVYVPIEPEYPANRIESMVMDTGAETVLADKPSGELREKFISCGILSGSILDISLLVSDEHKSHTPRPSRPILPSDIACFIFTSGSTGRPKGVPVGHGQLFLVMRGYHDFVQTTSSDRFVLASSLTFDASFAAIFGAVLRGGMLYVALKEECFSPPLMVNMLVTRSISYCAFTPTQLRMLLQANNSTKLRQWHSLRVLTLCGERLPPELLKILFALRLPNARISQGYGPTETTMGNSFRLLDLEDAEGSFVPLGQPIPPAKFYIMDGRGREVPTGIAGELYIAGPTVNTGYLNREEATQEAFLKHPMATSEEIENGHDRLYRTGDCCRLHWDGSIEILGRISGDRQVKIRGIRTTLTEIESVIWEVLGNVDETEAALVSQVTVVYHETPNSLSGTLAAYIVPTADTADDEDLQRSCKELARNRIRANLPAHMMPSAILFVSSLPTTTSGKTDYKTVTQWPAPKADMPRALYRTTQCAEALSSCEAGVSEIWSQVLNTEVFSTPEYDFFSVGGHSLILIQVQESIKERYNVIVALSDLFAQPTIRGMASLIESKFQQQGDFMLTNGAKSNGLSNEAVSLPSSIDWDAETRLSEVHNQVISPCTIKLYQPKIAAITGACSMGGAYFIAQALMKTKLCIYCLATEGQSDADAFEVVLANLQHWRLRESIGDQALCERLTVYHGALHHPTLGLSETARLKVEQEVDAFYLFAAEISLLKHYDSLRASNIDSLRFIINLALSNPARPKPIAYLSTWGVPHLQTFHGTMTDQWRDDEVLLDDLHPSAHGPGYLKVRWVCEQLLGAAARHGLPVHIFRVCMCGSSTQGVPLPQEDINRRILVESLRLGMLPDFGSQMGGGMSWVGAEFVVRAMLHLMKEEVYGEPAVHHLVSDRHLTYDELSRVLEVSFGAPMRSVHPTEWLEALRTTGNAELVIHVEVLEQWWKSGWVPFGLAHTKTLSKLQEAGITPPAWDNSEFLRDHVIGKIA